MALRFTEPAEECYQFPLTIKHLLGNCLTHSAQQEIIYRDQARFTYSELVGRIARLASLLTGVGADAGMTIAVMDWDSHRYLESYFAIPMMGAVLQTVNVRLPAEQLAYTLRHARAEILLVHRDFFPLLEEILPSLQSVRTVVAIMDGGEGELPPFAVGEYEAMIAAASPDYRFEDFDENAVATTFYTSGTTGNPKGVCFTHRQLVIQTMVGKGPFGATERSGLSYRDVYMPLTPMFHVHAWGYPYLATLLGVKQVYPGRYDPDMICRLKTEHQVTYSHCVPTIASMIFKAADANGTDLSGWTIGIGGAAMTSVLCEEGARRGALLKSGYGMSETAPTVAVSRLPRGETVNEDKLTEALTGVVLCPLVSARIVDEEMNDVPHDGVSRGELVLRAPWLTQEYTGDRAATTALWRGGWMHTQDLATIDRDGIIRIRDRLKDVIKSGGEWIDSLAVEDLLIHAPCVAEVALIAVPDKQWGERPLAVIVPVGGEAVTLQALNQMIDPAIAAGLITRYARLDRYDVVDALPRTSVGKIDKKLLRARYADASKPVAGARP